MRPDGADFDQSFCCLIEPALAELAAELAGIGSLGPAERDVLLTAAAESVTAAVRRKVSRVWLVELNAARVNGELVAGDSAGRWSEFLQSSSTIGFWLSLQQHYPVLLPRLAAVVDGRIRAVLEFARRFAADRTSLAVLTGPGEGGLTSVEFGAGDSHLGGRTVAVLTVGAASVVYKPRSLAVDVALAEFLRSLFPGVADADRIRVPRALNRGSYGWSEFVAHRYCETAEELTSYYHRLGHWLALARFFGTTDLHAENLIACGPTPVIVDCETLFTPRRMLKPVGAGDAGDDAALMLMGSVLSSGMLPSRGKALGWRGADISAGAALPAEQPTVELLQIVAGGTDQARLEPVAVPMPTAKNQPSRSGVLDQYWPRALAGFEELTGRLRERDAAGGLADALAGFVDVDIRAVLRSTELYAELARMLWHPASLHDEGAAVQRAGALLARHSAQSPAAPSDPQLIAGEIADLLSGDVPYFYTTPRSGWIRGPHPADSWGEPHDVLAESLDRWRAVDLDVEREVIRSSLVCAFINDGYLPRGAPMTAPELDPVRLDELRRGMAAGIVQRLCHAAIRGADGTATWIAPVMNMTGWSVQPLSSDGYSGTAGVALLLAGYQQEVIAGRAEPVAGAPELLEAVIETMRRADDFRSTDRQSEYLSRPEPAGLYIGLGSEIWCWRALGQLAAVDAGEAMRRCVRIAELLPEAADASEEPDLLRGRAGAVVALLGMAELTGNDGWLQLAIEAGDRLAALATVQSGQARWSSPAWPDGIGSTAHGATGIGWALARLSLACGRPDFAELADAAFAFEESLWNPVERGWRDARAPGGTATAWCHGATGIGLIATDLIGRGYRGRTDHADVVRRAAESCWQQGMGWNHTLCHGDLGCWELLVAALDLGLAPTGLDRTRLELGILSGIHQHGPTSGLAHAAFVPSLMPGLSGVAYQLLRMHPACPLPSVLVIN